MSKARIKELVSKIREAKNAYYNDEPIMTDSEYDELYDELMELDPENPELSETGAPVPVASVWPKAKHKIAMGSLNKCNVQEGIGNEIYREVREWHRKCGRPSVTLSNKLDGISLDLEYSNGRLVRGITRGDGITGEDITKNVLKMNNVYDKVIALDDFSLRGEIILFQGDFEDLNKLAEKNGDRIYKNKRNAVSGIARDLNGKYCRFLSVVYYDTTLPFDTALERFEFLKDALKVPTSLVKGNIDIDKCIEIYNEYEEEIRAGLEFDIDGLVIEVDDLKKKKALGELYGNPMGAIAFKFGSMKAESIVKNIEWQMGNSGRLTPVCIIEPVQLAGVTVQKASLHNIDMFMALDLCVGDTVLVSRRNDVIPYIESVVKRSKKEKFEYPSQCPICNHETKIDGKFLVCDNPECSAKVSGDIKVWVKKLELKGIADATIETLCAKEMVTEPADLYTLTIKQLRDFGGFGPRQSEIIYNIIQSKKEVTLPEFVGGLNLANFGRRMTDLLVEAGHDTLDKVMNLQEYELTAIKGIEIKTARSFLSSIQAKKDIIKHLLQAGITIKEKEKVMVKTNTNSKITGKSFVFTGAVERIDEKGERYTRNRLQALVIENGGMTPSSIAKGVDFLVQADPSSTSSKTQKANKLGVTIISEADFFKMLGM